MIFKVENSLKNREFFFFVEKTFDKISLIYIIKPSKFFKGEVMEIIIYLFLAGVVAILVAIIDFLLEQRQKQSGGNE